MGIYLPRPLTNKKFHSCKQANIKYTLCQMQGWRRQMEDAAICDISLGDGNSLFAVFDGHSGSEVSSYVKSIFKDTLMKSDSYQRGSYENAMIETFQNVDKILRSDEGETELARLRKAKSGPHTKKEKQNQYRRVGDFSGCTANVVLVTPLVYVVANSGDSRSILSRNQKSIEMSFDHKPQNANQYQRIINSGATIINGRVNGVLNLSRGFGDFRFKDKSKRFDETAITCSPDVRIFPRSPQDEFILIGCDGIFERHPIHSQPFVNFIRSQQKSKKKSEKILGKLFDMLLAKDVRDVYGCDNMTAILIQF